MEFEGTVVAVLPVVKGTSARGEWIKQEVVFEQAGDFGRKVCVGFWGDRAQDAGTLKPGEKYRLPPTWSRGNITADGIPKSGPGV